MFPIAGLLMRGPNEKTKNDGNDKEET